MLSLKPFKNHFHLSPLLHNSPSLSRPPSSILYQARNNVKDKRLVIVRCTAGEEKKGERRSFLSSEEAGLVEISGLSTHERFLCRLTVKFASESASETKEGLNLNYEISSLNLLRVISEQEGIPIEELNAGRICDWFLKDKLKREQNLESAVLQWDDSDFPI